MSLRSALFLDRDGVINVDHAYVYKQENFEFVDGIFELCRAARAQGYELIVVTNQAGIGRGYYTEADFAQLTEWMCKRFSDEGAPITDVFYCPHHPEYGIGEYHKDSFDRKPNPGMLLRAAEKHQLSLPDSIMLGDKESDMQAARSAGVEKRLLFCHTPEQQQKGSQGAVCIMNLHDAIPLIIAATPRA